MLVSRAQHLTVTTAVFGFALIWSGGTVSVLLAIFLTILLYEPCYSGT